MHRKTALDAVPITDWGAPRAGLSLLVGADMSALFRYCDYFWMINTLALSQSALVMTLYSGYSGRVLLYTLHFTLYSVLLRMTESIF